VNRRTDVVWEEDMTRDPVCGMLICDRCVRAVTCHRNEEYAFCSRGCRAIFEQSPSVYLSKRDAERAEQVTKGRICSLELRE
jgi:YHS domain-containing protein